MASLAPKDEPPQRGVICTVVPVTSSLRVAGISPEDPPEMRCPLPCSLLPINRSKEGREQDGFAKNLS